jgi:hypothetical protein
MGARERASGGGEDEGDGRGVSEGDGRGAASGAVGTDPFAVHRELFAAVAERRRGVHADAMARRLLGHERGPRSLVGVTADGECALYYAPSARTLVVVAFDADGVGTAVRETLARDLDDPAAWLAVHGDDLAWVHPRHR